MGSRSFTFVLFCQPFKKPATNQKTRNQETKKTKKTKIKTNPKEPNLCYFHESVFFVFFVFWFLFFCFVFPLFLFPLQQIGIGQQTCSRQIIVFLDNLRKNIANLCTLVVPCSEGISVCLYVCISLHFTVCLRLSLRMHACM